MFLKASIKNLINSPIANEEILIEIEENGQKLKQASVVSDDNGLVSLTFNPGWAENIDALKTQRNIIVIKVKTIAKH